MPSNPIVVCAILAGCLQSGLTAQVVTVGGSNPDYLDLPAAVAAVAPGTIVVVRAGKFAGFTTNKGLIVHLEFDARGGSITAAAGAAYAITLDGMPANQVFTLHGEGARVDAGRVGAIRVANTAGRVVVEGLTIEGGASAMAIDVQNAGPVLLHDCELSGTPALSVQLATVAANDVRVSSPVGHGVAAFHATIDFAGGSIGGTDLPALSVIDSDVRLAGDGSTPIKVGTTSPWPVSAFAAVNSTVQWDANQFAMEPANGAQPFASTGTTVVGEDPPIVTAQGAAPGDSGWIRITSNTPMAGMVVVAPFVPPVFFGLSALYIDPGQPFSTPLVGLVDPAGLSLSFTMPSTASLLGDVSCVQGLVFPAVGVWTFSGPVPLTVL